MQAELGLRYLHMAEECDYSKEVLKGYSITLTTFNLLPHILFRDNGHPNLKKRPIHIIA